MDHNELVDLPGAVWVAVEVGGGAVGGPPGVRDAHVLGVHPLHVEGVLHGLDLVLQALHLVCGLQQRDAGVPAG